MMQTMIVFRRLFLTTGDTGQQGTNIWILVHGMNHDDGIQAMRPTPQGPSSADPLPMALVRLLALADAAAHGCRPQLAAAARQQTPLQSQSRRKPASLETTDSEERRRLRRVASCHCLLREVQHRPGPASSAGAWEWQSAAVWDSTDSDSETCGLLRSSYAADSDSCRLSSGDWHRLAAEAEAPE